MIKESLRHEEGHHGQTYGKGSLILVYGRELEATRCPFGRVARLGKAGDAGVSACGTRERAAPASLAETPRQSFEIGCGWAAMRRRWIGPSQFM